MRDPYSVAEVRDGERWCEVCDEAPADERATLDGHVVAVCERCFYALDCL